MLTQERGLHARRDTKETARIIRGSMLECQPHKAVSPAWERKPPMFILIRSVGEGVSEYDTLIIVVYLFVSFCLVLRWWHFGDSVLWVQWLMLGCLFWCVFVCLGTGSDTGLQYV